MAAPTYKFDGWALRTGRRELISPDGTVVCLSASDFDLLAILCQHPQCNLSRAFLVESLTAAPRREMKDETVGVSIHRLRLRIERDIRCPELIKTVKYGFWFAPEVAVE